MRVVQNTYVLVGTAVVFDTTKAVLGWTRQGTTLEINSYGDTQWTTNSISYRCEERIAIGVQRPAAVNIVTGLAASS